MSEFWERKLKTFFRRFDSDEDGILTKEDFISMAEKLSDGQGVGSDRKQVAVNAALSFYYPIAKIVGEDKSLTEESFIEGFRKLRYDPKYHTLIKDAAKVGFDLLDLNGDGHIQVEEYVKFLYSIRIPDYENLAKIAFKGLDTNGDGVLSREEFRDAIADFFASDDESGPGTLAYGPLI